MSCKGRQDILPKSAFKVLNPQPKRTKPGNVAKKAVVVAVKASKEISRTALVWALTNVVQPGDSITLLVVVPPQSSGNKLWGFPRFAGGCANGQRRTSTGASLEIKSEITDTCSQMMLQLHNVYDPSNINLKIKIVSGTPPGAVAMESKRAQASWVIIDKQLKNEEKQCVEELQCNIVIMKRSQPKVLRVNLVRSPEAEIQSVSSLLPETDCKISSKPPRRTPTSSPDLATPFTATEAATSSPCSSDPGTSPCEGGCKKGEAFHATQTLRLNSNGSDSSESEISTLSKRLERQPWVQEIFNRRQTTSAKIQEKSDEKSDLEIRNSMPSPPPICSICLHKSPVLGKPPRWFSYAELELATGGFSQANFLAEGGFGSVFRGVLSDGQTVAVKQHKMASSQGDSEFCAEVEVLSCAQHRNLVMLIGFCIEDQRRLLVYEFVCNGSLDAHLYGRNGDALEWSARQNIAVGAARGLRYLHEECRVGCIVHRDMRPNNILLTHDFEPLVGDFGLARWQPDGGVGVETRVLGTFGYLAPEYVRSGEITGKADVYSFGVVLLELVTGRKAVDIHRPKGQQCLTEWARPFLEENAVAELVDPRLGRRYSYHEAQTMINAASLCLRRDPLARPRISQVLRMLEGGEPMLEGSFYLSTPRSDRGSWSARMWTGSELTSSGPIPPKAHQFPGQNRRRTASFDGIPCEESTTRD
ncbi:inactive protein kinase SELMODRAFT_444075-like isoform X2 [Wolffia australiana]